MCVKQHACYVIDLCTQGDGIALCRCIAIFLLLWQRGNGDWLKMFFVRIAVTKHSFRVLKKRAKVVR